MSLPLLPTPLQRRGRIVRELWVTAVAKTAAPLSTEPKPVVINDTPTSGKPENDNLARMSPASRRAYIRLREKQQAKAAGRSTE